jgi:hypothetical protein
VLSEEFIAAVEKALTLKGFDLKVDFDDVEFWDEAIFFTKSLLSEREVEHVTYYHTFMVEFLLGNGNLILLTYRPGGCFNDGSC